MNSLVCMILCRGGAPAAVRSPVCRSLALVSQLPMTALLPHCKRWSASAAMADRCADARLSMYMHSPVVLGSLSPPPVAEEMRCLTIDTHPITFPSVLSTVGDSLISAVLSGWRRLQLQANSTTPHGGGAVQSRFEQTVCVSICMSICCCCRRRSGRPCRVCVRMRDVCVIRRRCLHFTASADFRLRGSRGREDSAAT